MERTEPAFARVARLTAELFFEIGEVKVMEALIQAPRVRGPDGDSPVLQLDEDVAERLRLGTKQVRQYLGRLHTDRLVVKLRADVAKEKSADEPPPLANEAPLLTAGSVRCYYGLDYTTLVDSVLYKLDSMERALEAERRSAGEMQLYHCPRCSTTVDSLSISPLMMMEGTLKCETCATELDEVDNSVQMKSLDQRKAQLRTGLQPLREALREVHGTEPPLYKRPRAADEAAGEVGGAGVVDDRAGGGACGGGGRSAVDSESTLGASRGPATARGAAAAPAATVPWMLSASEAAAAHAPPAADVPASTALDVQALAFEERVRQSMAPAASSLDALLPPLLPVPSAVPVEAEMAEEEEEEVMVLVAGVPMAFSDITETEQDRMSPEEYERYAELYAEAVG